MLSPRNLIYRYYTIISAGSQHAGTESCACLDTSRLKEKIPRASNPRDFVRESASPYKVFTEDGETVTRPHSAQPRSDKQSEVYIFTKT